MNYPSRFLNGDTDAPPILPVWVVSVGVIGDIVRGFDWIRTGNETTGRVLKMAIEVELRSLGLSSVITYFGKNVGVRVIEHGVF